ncbi:MAG: hypothetical protein RI894_1028 [Bacteroidota bacterium]|jgi:SanA protein
MAVLTIRQQRELEARERNLRQFLRGICVVLLVLFAAFWAGNSWVKDSAAPYTYSDADKLPKNKVGMVLGTNKWIKTGVKNDYFVKRIESAALLYNNEKVEHLILSGDSSQYYNEPKEMQEALVALGVPKEAMTLDFSGYRTYESVLRGKYKYDLTSFTIISQLSHNYRAVFVARKYGIAVIAYNAEAPEGSEGKRNYREFWARIGAIFDVYINPHRPNVEKTPLVVEPIVHP